MIIPHYEIIINHHHFIWAPHPYPHPSPTGTDQTLSCLDRTGWLWMQSSGMNFPRVQGCAYLSVSPSPAEGQRFLISSWWSKLWVHPAQPFPSFLLVQRGKLRHSKGSRGLQEITSKGALSFYEQHSTWLSCPFLLYKDGADIQSLPPWRQGISCS